MYRFIPIALILAACAGNDEAPEAQAADSSHTEQVITLAVGESRTLPGGQTIGVPGIANDSRCPANVQCIWAGSAGVNVSLRVTTSDTLATINSGIDPKSFSFRGWQVRLQRVEPGPGEPMERYRVTLGVSQK